MLGYVRMRSFLLRRLGAASLQGVDIRQPDPDEVLGDTATMIF